MIDQKYEEPINKIIQEIRDRGLFTTHKGLSKETHEAVRILEELEYIKLIGNSYKFTVIGFNASSADEAPFNYIQSQLVLKSEKEAKAEQLTELTLKDLKRRTGIYGLIGGAIGFIGLEGIKWLVKFIYSLSNS
jgi:hypothetical protein